MLDCPDHNGKRDLNAWQRWHVRKQVAVSAGLQVGRQRVGSTMAIRRVVWRRLRGAKRGGKKSRPIAARGARLGHGRRECRHQDRQQSQKAANLQVETREHGSGRLGRRCRHGARLWHPAYKARMGYITFVNGTIPRDQYPGDMPSRRTSALPRNAHRYRLPATSSDFLASGKAIGRTDRGPARALAVRHRPDRPVVPRKGSRSPASRVTGDVTDPLLFGLPLSRGARRSTMATVR
ncbi:hypothetical protein SAMN05192548_10233 [Paraburkholderia terricola]|uniref:Uncharacterized protein n=1 Tax=Paraburkholderia terricola TaxID=169427 RepID=A0A1M6SL04_9BURK|nr:hypothetical protein SAMN05192547_102292 [Paraburkholderia sediminicola]SHK45421.1 hypothetical protein SAMN05192548_10233 [Paraburkholderia terricola]